MCGIRIPLFIEPCSCGWWVGGSHCLPLHCRVCASCTHGQIVLLGSYWGMELLHRPVYTFKILLYIAKSFSKDSLSTGCQISCLPALLLDPSSSCSFIFASPLGEQWYLSMVVMSSSFSSLWGSSSPQVPVTWFHLPMAEGEPLSSEGPSDLSQGPGHLGGPGLLWEWVLCLLFWK